MYDMMLLQQASMYKLTERQDRIASRDTLQDLFVELQTLIKPDITLEIGAMKAAFSCKMASAGITAYAFEANTYNFEKFKPVIDAKELPVKYIHRAICEVDGEVQFQLRSKVNGTEITPIKGNNSLMLRNTDLEDAEYNAVTVPASRLSTFLKTADLTKKTFSAWIDVEGALGRVIKGFDKSLQFCQSILVELEEVSYWQGQMLYLDAMSYFLSQGFVPVARDFESRHQFNVLFLSLAQLKNPKVRLALQYYFQGKLLNQTSE